MRRLPEEDTLAQEVREIGMDAVARKYGVKYNAVYMALSRAKSVDRSEVIKASRLIEVKPAVIEETKSEIPSVKRLVNGYRISVPFLSFLDGEKRV